MTKLLTFIVEMHKIPSMDQPLSASKLGEFLPHRPPMLWVDSVTEVGKDYKGITGKCLISLDPKALYVSNGESLRGTSAIEFTAQGFGYLKAAYQVLNDVKNPPKKVFLTGVRSCKADFSAIDLDKTKQLEVSISVVREMSPLTFVKGVVRVPGDDKVLAETEIQVYFA